MLNINRRRDFLQQMPYLHSASGNWWKNNDVNNNVHQAAIFWAGGYQTFGETCHHETSWGYSEALGSGSWNSETLDVRDLFGYKLPCCLKWHGRKPRGYCTICQRRREKPVWFGTGWSPFTPQLRPNRFGCVAISEKNVWFSAPLHGNEIIRRFVWLLSLVFQPGALFVKLKPFWTLCGGLLILPAAAPLYSGPATFAPLKNIR
ncbi:hypothetical protein GX48_08275 [Paracoccidioides brasiliensis]|nr:hypothetical protein GX48_08275 [Paracoccidioides brasiliensis]